MELTLTSNKKFLYINSCTDIEYEQLKSSLTKQIDGWRWHPLVKKGLWDGKISFMKHNKVPSGLWKEVTDIFNEYNYDIKINGIQSLFDIEFNEDHFNEWVDKFFETYEKKPRDYQVETAVKILKSKRCLAQLATSAGKSMIVFIAIAYLLEIKKMKRILMIVPNVSLVIQASEDFHDYNHEDRIPLKIQQVYAGMKIKKNSNIVIGTYQSLVKKKQEFFDSFDAVIIDEVHRANGASIRTILDKLWHCDYRFGVSGTVPKKGTVNRLTLMSNTGPLITNINASYLIGRGFITKCEVKILEMKYVTNEQKDAFYSLSKTPEDRKKLFSLEQQFIVNNIKRLEFITDVISKVNKNTLVLFHRIEHGNALYEMLKKKSKNAVFHVDGGTNKDLREEYKKAMDVDKFEHFIIEFGNRKVKVFKGTKVPLFDGTFKLAENLKITDDVDDNWINTNLI